MPDMNGMELFRLGRRLMKVGVSSLPPSPVQEMPVSVRMVLVDVFENPGTTIGQIVERTRFPQSHVSGAVARLRNAGVLMTETDPDDRRRTIVAPSAAHLANVERARATMPTVEPSLEALLVERFGAEGAGRVTEVTDALELLASLLLPAPTLLPVTAGAPDRCASGDLSC
jgi:DNA-binding MarR family transcriptional regulator